MRKAWTATVHDALRREDGRFWDNLRASPEWAAYEAKIAQIMAPERVQLAEWGERCPDFEPECPACQAWRLFDASGTVPTVEQVTNAICEV